MFDVIQVSCVRFVYFLVFLLFVFILQIFFFSKCCTGMRKRKRPTCEDGYYSLLIVVYESAQLVKPLHWLKWLLLVDGRAYYRSL